MTVTILEKTEGRASYHDSVEEMLHRIREDGMSNVLTVGRLKKRFAANFVWKD